uniref:Uncharacterized protein n=1 Tax=Haptolina ericina TaxID=156174 RepID=A0A7S3AQQ2_9EUKA|mmetsp:Transcript_30678/g.69165  ORF Transcript_30678/g.69165 Transcript_30678/m.69165 type:complete len:147 (+) Transcript_30678:135-575(+)
MLVACKTAEFISLALFEHAHRRDSSLALPTHLDATAGALAGHAEAGHWGKVLPIAAAFTGQAASFPSLLSRLSSRDRAVHALACEQYVAAVTENRPLHPLSLSQNPQALSYAKEEAARDRAMAEGGSGGHVTSGRWRLQREKKQRH